jgi:hypothetical protein
LAPIDLRELGNADATAATGQEGHHIDHCGLQDFDLLSSSDSESKEEFFASNCNESDGF